MCLLKTSCVPGIEESIDDGDALSAVKKISLGGEASKGAGGCCGGRGLGCNGNAGQGVAWGSGKTPGEVQTI